MKGILGRKVGMTQIFTQDGTAIPATVIEVLPNKVLQIKTVEKDGYDAVQLGVEDQKVSRVNKPDMGRFKKASSNPKRFVKEIRNFDSADIKENQEIKADIFSAGELVDVTGISKGKGFSGAIKRHNYSIGPKGHGSGYHRGVGSMGAIINRIFKGKGMAGQMGNAQVTVQNLEVVKVDITHNAIIIKGSIPGPKKSFVMIKNTKMNNKVKTLKERDIVNYAKTNTPKTDSDKK